MCSCNPASCSSFVVIGFYLDAIIDTIRPTITTVYGSCSSDTGRQAQPASIEVAHGQCGARDARVVSQVCKEGAEQNKKEKEHDTAKREADKVAKEKKESVEEEKRRWEGMKNELLFLKLGIFNAAAAALPVDEEDRTYGRCTQFRASVRVW